MATPAAAAMPSRIAAEADGAQQAEEGAAPADAAEAVALAGAHGHDGVLGHRRPGSCAARPRRVAVTAGDRCVAVARRLAARGPRGDDLRVARSATTRRRRSPALRSRAARASRRCAARPRSSAGAATLVAGSRRARLRRRRRRRTSRQAVSSFLFKRSNISALLLQGVRRRPVPFRRPPHASRRADSSPPRPLARGLLRGRRVGRAGRQPGARPRLAGASRSSGTRAGRRRGRSGCCAPWGSAAVGGASTSRGRRT